jgi:alginate O-acetyltransferase complex protein AlgJ
MLKILSVLLLLLAGLVSVALRGGDAIVEILSSSTRQAFQSGALSGKIDRAVFDAIPKSSRLDGVAAGLQYAVLHDAGPQVWAGCGDWLYSIEELRADRHDAENLRARARIMSFLVQAFAKEGIPLFILPVPDKAEQVEDQLCGISAERSRFRSQAWSRATSFIERSEIELKSNWPRPGYFRTDTHWNNEGAEFAAKAVALAIEARLGRGTDNIKLASGASHAHIGDLVRVAGLAQAPRQLAPPNEQELSLQTEIARSGGLLDEVPSPSIVLAGSSFSLNSGFREYLEALLLREVAQVSQAGGGFAGAVLDLLQRRPSVLVGAKAVIWEYPMRTLTAPLTPAEQRLFDQLDPPQ